MTQEAKLIIRASDKTKKAFSSVNNSLKGMKSFALGAAGAIGGALAIRGVGQLLESNRALVDSLAKMSDKTGIATERLQAYHQAAVEGGGSVKGMNESLTKMSKRLAETAALGSGAATQWIKKLNLDVSELQKLSPDQLFAKYSKSINGLNTQGEKLAAISALMGDKSRSLINVIEGGPSSIDAMEKSLFEMGATITRIDAAKIEAANDAMDRTKFVSQGIATSFNVALAPVLEGIAHEYLNIAKEAGGAGELANRVVGSMVKGAGHVANAVQGITLAWTAVKHGAVFAIAKVIDLLVTADSALTSFVNKYTPWTKEVSQGILALSESMKQMVKKSGEELRAEVNKPLNSIAIDEWFANAVSKSEQAAIEIAESKKLIFAPPDPQKIDDSNSQTATFLERNRLAADEYNKIWDSTFQSFSSGMGDAVGSALVEQQSFTAAMEGLAKGVIKQVISGLVEIGVKQLILSKIGATAKAAEGASSKLLAGAVGSAWIGPATLVSAATFGGSAAAGGTALLATAGIASGIALSGVAHDGLSSVPTDGTYLLQKGEKVVSNGDSKKLDDILAKGLGQNVNLSFSISAIDTQTGMEFIDRSIGAIIEKVQEKYNDRGLVGPLG